MRVAAQQFAQKRCVATICAEIKNALYNLAAMICAEKHENYFIFTNLAFLVPSPLKTEIL